MTDLALQAPVLERAAAELAGLRDGLEACARVLAAGAPGGLGAPGLDAAAGALAGSWERAAALLAAAADELSAQAQRAASCFADLDAALVPR